MQQWNTYGSRSLAAWLQKSGIVIIPNVRFNDKCMIELQCLKPSLLVLTDVSIDKEYFKNIIAELFKRLSPKNIIVSGATPDDIFKVCKDAGTEIISFERDFKIHQASDCLMGAGISVNFGNTKGVKVTKSRIEYYGNHHSLAGANSGQISVVYNGEQYMLKFPLFPAINKEMRYTNSCIIEYLGCKIFGIIDNTPTITELQKEFYKTMLTARKEHIIDFSLKRLKIKIKEA